MSQDEQRLRQLDREWNEAYSNGDVEALERILADDWTAIDGAGLVISKRQLLERVGSSTQPFDWHEFDEFRLRLFGDSAVVTGRLSARGRTSSGEFSFRQRYTRVYVKREEVWQAVAAQVTVVSGA
ncbi:MAG: nuclear transport factor 2 family protein [Acidobacteriota bacterium]|nr:nuclear transport factor 2 family protein [Acidobacteriota bacterium]MDQ5835659.1 nuclear transport factor 2 family protein [Acidobacteriota bacterium]